MLGSRRAGGSSFFFAFRRRLSHCQKSLCICVIGRTEMERDDDGMWTCTLHLFTPIHQNMHRICTWLTKAAATEALMARSDMNVVNGSVKKAANLMRWHWGGCVISSSLRGEKYELLAVISNDSIIIERRSRILYWMSCWSIELFEILNSPFSLQLPIYSPVVVILELIIQWWM